mgnify:CR=1 FL=1
MKKLDQLYEGKAKKVFATDDPDVVIVDYKDDATAFNGEKKGTIVFLTSAEKPAKPHIPSYNNPSAAGPQSGNPEVSWNTKPVPAAGYSFII